MPKSALVTVLCGSLASGLAAAEQTACQAGKDRVLSYVGGVAGFRPNENFIREWRREAPATLVGAPQFIETLSFNGDDAALTYDYEIDARREAPGAAPDDAVHNLNGRGKIGAAAYIQSYWDRDDKTLMAHIRCNDTRRPEGDCRIGFEDARRLGTIAADGPVIVLFIEGDAPSDICIQSLGAPGPWRLVLDGAASEAIVTPCAGRAQAEAFVSAGAAQAVMPSTFAHNKGEPVANTLRGDDIAAALAFTAYVRKLNYARTPAQTAWLDDLVAGSKAAFAKAGDALNPCTPQEPPT